MAKQTPAEQFAAMYEQMKKDGRIFLCPKCGTDRVKDVCFTCDTPEEEEKYEGRSVS